jgi:hypothetical protein
MEICMCKVLYKLLFSPPFPQKCMVGGRAPHRLYSLLAMSYMCHKEMVDSSSQWWKCNPLV